ncbi:MAG: hypothetical protein LBU00_00630 [Treponema sp.]|jgi:hypothetical protein|nr:hypothetical protein [Treponema sp.]
MFCEYEKDNVSFDQFDIGVLEAYGIKSKRRVDSMIAQFTVGFNRDREK